MKNSRIVYVDIVNDACLYFVSYTLDLILEVFTYHILIVIVICL